MNRSSLSAIFLIACMCSLSLFVVAAHPHTLTHEKKIQFLQMTNIKHSTYCCRMLFIWSKKSKQKAKKPTYNFFSVFHSLFTRCMLPLKRLFFFSLVSSFNSYHSICYFKRYSLVDCSFCLVWFHSFGLQLNLFPPVSINDGTVWSLLTLCKAHNLIHCGMWLSPLSCFLWNVLVVGFCPWTLFGVYVLFFFPLSSAQNLKMYSLNELMLIQWFSM